jgi:hypothetical protein
MTRFRDSKRMCNRNESIVAAIFLVAVSQTFLPLTAWPAPIRLAIVASERALDSEADLLTVTLSQEAGLMLVERGQIDRVVGEQQRAAGGLGDCLRLGQLLRADGVVALRRVRAGQQELLVADLVAVRLGFRLDMFADAYPAKDLDGWRDSIRSRFVPLLPKLAVQPEDAVPVSLLNIRAAAGTTEARVLERSLSFLLEARLVREARVFVLERQNLGTLEFDKDYVAGSEPLRWARTRFLVDGELIPGGADPKNVRLRLNIEPPNGRPAMALTLTGSQEHLGDLVDKAAAEILSAIGQPVREADWQPNAEARRFYRETLSADRAGLDGEALAAGEASRALGYRSEELTALIARQSCRKAFSGRGGLSDGYDRSQVDESTFDIGLIQRALNLSEREMKTDPGAEVRLTAGRAIRYYKESDRYEAQREQLEILRTTLRTMVERLTVEQKATNDMGFCAFIGCYAPYLYDDPQEVLGWYRKLLRHRFSGDSNYAIYQWSRLRHYLGEARDKPRLFGTGDSAQRTPWLVSWRGESPESLRQMWEAFLEELSRSESANDQMDGLFLRLYSVEDPVARAGIEDQIRNAVWQNREAVVSDTFTYAIAVQLLCALPGAGEEFRFKLLDYFFCEAKFYNWQIFEKGLIWVNGKGGFGFTNPEFRSALLKSMDAYGERIKSQGSFQPAEFAKYRKRLANASPTDVTNGSTHALEVKRSWVPSSLIGPWSGYGDFSVRKVLYRDSHLWVIGKGYTLSSKTNAAWIRLFQVDPETLVSSALDVPLDFPMKPSGPNKMNYDFEISPQFVFVATEGKLIRYDRAARTWDSVEVPSSEFPSLTLVGDALHYAFPGHMGKRGSEVPQSGIIRIDPRTLEQEVLASSRRKQPATVLDDVSPYKVPSLFLGPGGRVHAVVNFDGVRRGENVKVFCYDETAKNWTRVLTDELEGNTGRFGLLAFPTGDSTLFQRLHVISKGAEFSALLYHADGRLERLINAVRTGERRSPWIAPEVPWDYSSTPWTPLVATKDGKNYWVLLKDNGGPLALFHYRPGIERPTMLHLDFASVPRSIATDYSPGLIATPQGLVLANIAGAAFWMVSWAELTGEASDP